MNKSLHGFRFEKPSRRSRFLNRGAEISTSDLATIRNRTHEILVRRSATHGAIARFRVDVIARRPLPCPHQQSASFAVKTRTLEFRLPSEVVKSGGG